jgi:hypothetical protein
MSSIPAELRRFVVQRAAGRCEYCQLSQEGQEATFHIDHVIPVLAGGQTVGEHLGCWQPSPARPMFGGWFSPQAGTMLWRVEPP